MFRDLKEYQQIQKIYEDKVCISDEERIITSIFEEQEFTEEELAYVKENLEEVLNQVSIEILEEARDGKFLKEEILTEEDEKLLTEMLIGEGIGSAIKAGLKAAKPLAQKAAGAIKSGVQKAKPIVKKGLQKTGDMIKGAVGKVKQGVKAVVKNPTVQKVAKTGLAVSGLGAAAVGIKKGIDALRNKKPETKVTPDKPIGGGNAGGSTDSGGTQGQGGGQQTTTEKPKKMHSIEKKNRARFGDEKVDKLKAKQVDFKAMRKGTMSKDDFIKKYPKSITAQKAAGLRDHTEWDAYDMVLEYLYSTEQVSTIEEANYVMMEMDQETIGEIVNEVTYYLDEGIIDNLKAGASKVGNLVKKGVDTVKSAASGVKDKVEKRIERRKENVSINKRIKEKQSQPDASSGKTRAQVMALKRKKDKLNNPNKPQLSGREKAQAMAKARLAAKNK